MPNKILYNIHAFKLRQLPGYSIGSRKFATLFRADFREVEHQWQNVSTKFGPLTLMEGWSKIDPEDGQQEVWRLADSFFKTAPPIDRTLAKFRR